VPKNRAKRNAVSAVMAREPQTANDLVDAARRNAHVLRQPVLTDAQRLQELIEQDLAGTPRQSP
jgi:hypothetical protein